MSKIKILSVGECSYLHSGYAIYNKGLLTELHKNPEYDIYEFGLSFNPTYNQVDTVPWKFIPNVLPEHRIIDSAKKMEEWKGWFSNPINTLGGPLFNHVLLEVQPDIVIANQDEWNLRYMIDSPFRRFFKLICLFSCDSEPQKLEWIESMSRCDAVLTYSDWAKNLIKSQSPKVNVFSSASPSCQSGFRILDKDKCKESFGLNPKYKVIGTVMRNQIRKLYPSLFSSFKEFSDRSKDNALLWVHSKFPDSSWKFPELLMEYDVFDKVIFTYSCKNPSCRNVFWGFYQDIAECPKCREISGEMPGTNNGVDSEDLCRIYNAFDIYVQYSNSEGWGISLSEACSCGTHSMAVDWSAMKDHIKKLGVEPIPVLETVKEIQSGLERAVPDDKAFIKMLLNYFKKPEPIRRVLGLKARRSFELNYEWYKTGKIWSDAINSVYSPSDWSQPLDLQQPAEQTKEHMNYVDYARWLIAEVACTPDRLNSVYENEIVRNLIYQCRANICGNGIGVEYNKDIAYNEMKMVGDFRYKMELMRGKTLGLI
jgi:glycosyltransferase involved in cell wall biosynthesis